MDLVAVHVEIPAVRSERDDQMLLIENQNDDIQVIGTAAGLYSKIDREVEYVDELINKDFDSNVDADSVLTDAQVDLRDSVDCLVRQDSLDAI